MQISPSDPMAGVQRNSFLRTREIADRPGVASELFRRCFGHDIPAYPRHFALFYTPSGASEGDGRLIAYLHQSPYHDSYLSGGLCVDERAYRVFGRSLFEAVRREGGLATIILRDSLGLLADGAAAFAHVGESRSRRACLRAGYIDTGRPHLMVAWIKAPTSIEKERLIETVERHGPF